MKYVLKILLMMSLALTVHAEVTGGQAYNQYCASCHDQGMFGAPRVGDAGAWAQRISKGVVILRYNAINGYVGQRGVMPPKGGYLNIDDAEVDMAVQYMIDHSW